MECMGRRVDLVLLAECHLRAKILREGEVWTRYLASEGTNGEKQQSPDESEKQEIVKL